MKFAIYASNFNLKFLKGCSVVMVTFRGQTDIKSLGNDWELALQHFHGENRKVQ